MDEREGIWRRERGGWRRESERKREKVAGYGLKEENEKMGSEVRAKKFVWYQFRTRPLRTLCRSLVLGASKSQTLRRCVAGLIRRAERARVKRGSGDVTVPREKGQSLGLTWLDSQGKAAGQSGERSSWAAERSIHALESRDPDRRTGGREDAEGADVGPVEDD